jgi:hypothetical protein
MKRVVLAVLAFAGLASAEDHNCRDWNRHDEGVRLGIVLGMAHVWGGVPTKYYVEYLHIMTERQTWLPENNTYGEFIDGITAVCKQPENANLLYYQAMLLFILKVNGMSATDWDVAAAAIRKSMAR